MLHKTTRPSNYLYRSNLEFSIYHTQTAEVIYSLLIDGNLEAIVEITDKISSKSDEDCIQYAFMDKYGFDYEKKIQSMNDSFQDRERYYYQLKLE